MVSGKKLSRDHQVGKPQDKRNRLAGFLSSRTTRQYKHQKLTEFMKNPLMVFFYEAGRASIKNAISEVIADEVITNLSKNDLTDAYKAKGTIMVVDKRDAHLRTAKESDKAM